jgi:CRP/FNR family cyclic AMP-dependent transcriptional regulator
VNVRGRGTTLDERKKELVRAPLFEGLGDSALLDIARGASGQVLQIGGSIVLRPQRSAPLFLLVHGSMRVSLVSAGGREIVLTIAGPGEVLGELAEAREGGPDAPQPTMIAIAQESTRLLRIPSNVLRRSRTHAELTRRCNALLAERSRELLELVEDLALHPLDARLARVLARLQSRSSSHAVMRLHRLNQSTLAMMANATRPKVNQHLQRLRRLGVIELHEGTVRVRDRAALIRIARRE